MQWKNLLRFALSGASKVRRYRRKLAVNLHRRRYPFQTCRFTNAELERIIFGNTLAD